MAPRIRATLTKPQIIVLIRFLHSWDHRHGKVLDDIRPRWATEGNVDVVVFTHRTKRWSTSPSDAIPAASSSREDDTAASSKHLLLPVMKLFHSQVSMLWTTPEQRSLYYHFLRRH